MESLLSIKLCISYDALVEHPRTSHFLEIIKAMPMAVLMDDSVFDSQASCANCDCCLAVWLSQNIPLCPLAVGDARVRELEMRRVNRYAFVSSPFASALHQLAQKAWRKVSPRPPHRRIMRCSFQTKRIQIQYLDKLTESVNREVKKAVEHEQNEHLVSSILLIL